MKPGKASLRHYHAANSQNRPVMNEMDQRAELPKGATQRYGKVYNSCGELIERYDGKWMAVKDGSRSGWWRYHEHYDRNGYCDNPARGY
jgi:hypothetical protein